MGKIAFLLPGEGSQAVGMGADFVLEDPSIADFFELARAATQIDVFDICRQGPAEEMNKVENLCPCLTTAALATAKYMALHGIVPDCVAGYSVGEFAAHAIAGTIDDETALQLSAQRGALMAMASHRMPGGTATLIDCAPEQARELCGTYGAEQDAVLNIAGFDCPGRIRISGEEKALAAALAAWEAQDGKFLRSEVACALHSSAMNLAEQMAFRSIKNTIFMKASIDVYCGFDAQIFSADRADEALRKQMTAPVLWEQTIRKMIEDGVDTFIECAPRKTMSLSVEKTAESMGARVKVASVVGPADLDNLEL